MICINSVTVSPSSATVTKGQWYYGAYASISSNCSECAEVRWYSNDSSIASVNATTGYIYGVSTGTTRIYAEATDGSGKNDYITVTVTAPVAVTGISICPTSKKMNVGDTEYLYETVHPANATNQTVTWYSSNENVATVGLYSGKVTAQKAGTTTITATTADGCYQADCKVTVGYELIIGGRTITVYGEDDETLDEYESESSTELLVYANDMLLTTAREESNGDITVCMGEIVLALCTDYFLAPDLSRWEVTTSHKDLQIYREKTYNISDLGLCPFDNIRDRISLEQFVEDMGYSSKYSSITYSNGSRIIVIQGHDWYSAGDVHDLTDELTSMTLGLIPYAGDAKDLIESVTGKDLITGETLTKWDRIMCIGCTLLPVINGATVRVGRKGLTKLDNVIKYIDDLPDVEKVIFHSDVWEILRPITRGLIFEEEFANTVYTLSKGWYHVGKEMNGFFPVIDFIRDAEKIEDVLAVSMKTLDPRLYRLADGSYNITKIKKVINSYIEKLVNVDIFVDDVQISLRRLDLVVPEGFAEIIKGIGGLEIDKIIFNLFEE